MMTSSMRDSAFEGYAGRMLWLLLTVTIAFFIGERSEAQHINVMEVRGAPAWSASSHILVPHTRSFRINAMAPVIHVERVHAVVDIMDLTARTTLEITIRNSSNRQQEAVVLIPAPAGSAISGFMFEGTASEPMMEALPADEARRVYDAIVAQVRDPALLEFAGYNLLRSSVFPVEPHGNQRLRLTYENVLEANGDAVSYVLPRSASIDHRVPWSIDVNVRSRSAIVTAYSPTHDLMHERHSDRHVQLRMSHGAAIEPGTFRLFYLREHGEMAANVMAYPDPTVGGGYFMVTAGIAPINAVRQSMPKRDVVIVLDRSGSMAGEKMEQARHALSLALESLVDGETFNIIDFGTNVNRFASSPVMKNPRTLSEALSYVQRLGANGGTNTFGALLEALREPPPQGALPMMLFITDGLPTIGRTAEHELRALVERGNIHKRRMHTFGVGHDVGAPLLDRMADISRGTASYVLPHEDIRYAVANTLRSLRGPVFTDLAIEVRQPNGARAPGLLLDLQPVVLPDLFQGDHLVLLGRYTSEQPVTVRLSGKLLGKDRAFDISFNLASASTQHDFVPRLWATRRIAELIDKVRQLTPLVGRSHASLDPHVESIVAEIVELSTKFGILTEYTAFLAREGTRLDDMRANVEGCWSNLESRAVNTRSGEAAINQAYNFNKQKAQTALNIRNRHFDASMNEVEIAMVQQMADRALYNRNGCWIDSRVAVDPNVEHTPHRRIVLGTAEHRELLDQLILEARQALLAMPGDTLLMVNGEVVLVTNRVEN